MKEVIIATRNRHKADEIRAILPELDIVFRTLADFPQIPEVEENGPTLEENAVKKALMAAQATGKWAMGDDTGLEVTCLNGAPGVRSARYAGNSHDYAANNEKLLREMEGIPVAERTAVFRCVMALVSPSGARKTETGIISGLIAEKPAGTGGFGYDPLFYVPEKGFTLAQMSQEEKNKISHRCMVIRKMLPHLMKNVLFSAIVIITAGLCFPVSGQNSSDVPKNNFAEAVFSNKKYSLRKEMWDGLSRLKENLYKVQSCLESRRSLARYSLRDAGDLEDNLDYARRVLAKLREDDLGKEYLSQITEAEKVRRKASVENLKIKSTLSDENKRGLYRKLENLEDYVRKLTVYFNGLIVNLP